MTQLERAIWLSVPVEVCRLTKIAAARYAEVRKALGSTPDRAWLQPQSGQVAVENMSAATRLKEAGIDAIVQTERFPESIAWVPVKSAEFKLPFHVAGMLPSKLNAPFGGATPLASTITGGLLGSGLGYMGGALAENLLPSDKIQRGKLRRLTALLGGAAGAAPGMWLGSEAVRNHEGPGSKWNGLIEPNNLMGNPEPHPNDMGIDIKSAADGLRELIPDSMVSEQFLKSALDIGQGGAGGALFMPSIQVDAFNRMVMDDPFAGVKLQAATMGLTEAANQARGGYGVVSPYDIARVGLGMGAGLSQAYLAGKVLGALAGLRPEAQKQLQQAGMITGAIKAVVPGLFGN